MRRPAYAERAEQAVRDAEAALIAETGEHSHPKECACENCRIGRESMRSMVETVLMASPQGDA